MSKISDRITEARAHLKAAERSAYAAWRMETELLIDGGEKAERPIHKDAARAQAASHLPEDLRALLGIDRYGSKVR